MNLLDEPTSDNHCFVSINYSKALNQKRLVYNRLMCPALHFNQYLFSIVLLYELWSLDNFNSKIKYRDSKKAHSSDKINKVCDKNSRILCKQAKSLNVDWDNMLCRLIVKLYLQFRFTCADNALLLQSWKQIFFLSFLLSHDIQQENIISVHQM